jgi:hypothetical protein
MTESRGEIEDIQESFLYFLPYQYIGRLRLRILAYCSNDDQQRE